MMLFLVNFFKKQLMSNWDSHLNQCDSRRASLCLRVLGTPPIPNIDNNTKTHLKKDSILTTNKSHHVPRRRRRVLRPLVDRTA